MHKKDIYLLIFLGIFIFLIFFLIGQPILFYKKIPNSIYINKTQLKKDVKYLTNLKPSRDYGNHEVLNKAADYIATEFSKLDCDVEIQKFTIDKKEFKNIICSFGNDQQPRLIIGAHYDVFGLLPGADDNASGVAGILELARMITRERPEIKNRIDFIAYALEEPPYFNTDSMGSAIHAKSLKAKNVKVKGMISLEMIGYFSDESNSQNYPSPVLKLFYPNVGNFITVVGKLTQPTLTRKIKKSILENSSLDTRSINFIERLPGINFSDHLSYWKQGYDAIMVTDTSFYRNPNYHTENDTIETLDFDRMKEVVRGVYFAIINY